MLDSIRSTRTKSNSNKNMFSIPTLYFLVITVYVTNTHSYTWLPDHQRGAALRARWGRYQALPDKSDSALDGVCGQQTGVKCTTVAGRPSDAETSSCDIYCCRRGFVTGHCNPSGAINNAMSTRQTPGAFFLNAVSLHRFDCTCTNDERDAVCGPDGSLAGIRCPFDWSACKRKCCRLGRSGGRCGGFLRTKCKCD